MVILLYVHPCVSMIPPLERLVRCALVESLQVEHLSVRLTTYISADTQTPRQAVQLFTLARGFVRRPTVRRGCLSRRRPDSKPDTRRRDQGTSSDKRALEPHTARRVGFVKEKSSCGTDITATHLRPWLLTFICFPPFDKRIAAYSEERTSAKGVTKHSRPRSRLRPRDALLPALLISNSLPERDRQLQQNHVSGDVNHTSFQVHLVLPCSSPHRTPSIRVS